MKFALTVPRPGKANRKTGNGVAVIMAPRSTCPVTCPMRPTASGGNAACYAEQWPMSLHWTALDAGKRGDAAEATIDAVRQLPAGLPVRYATAGDLPGDGRTIDTALALALALVGGALAASCSGSWEQRAHRALVATAHAVAVADDMIAAVATRALKGPLVVEVMSACG